MTARGLGLRQPPDRFGWPVAILAGVAAAAVLAIAWNAGVKGVGAAPDVVRGATALLALVVVAGYAPARLLVPDELRVHLPLLVPLVGAMTAGLALSALGFIGLPLPISVAVLLAAGVAGALVVRVRLGPARPAQAELAAAGGRWVALIGPTYIALLLVAALMIPVMRDQLVSVPGTNPDAMLGAGTVELLRNAGPLDVRPELPVDRMPYVWDSKYPIYYVLAGAAELSGLSTLQLWAAASAVLAGLTAIGFFLLARYLLRAGPLAALLAMGLVAADRVLAHLALHPYHNQLWGTLALAPMLLFGLRFMQTPNRRDGALTALFLAVGLLAYPLMVLFPAVAFGAAGLHMWRERGTAQLPRPRLPRRRRALWLVASVAALPAALVLLAAALHKMIKAGEALLGSGPLWGGDVTSYRWFSWLVGVDGPAGIVTGLAIVAFALLGLWRAPRNVALPLGATVAVSAAVAVYLYVRPMSEYFHFKVVAFLFPLLLVAAACWLAARAGPSGGSNVTRLAAAGTLALIAAVLLLGLRNEIFTTNLQADRPTLELRTAAARILPPGASVRLDVKGGRQLWAGYVLADHPVTAIAPIANTTYPYPPQGRKADFIVAERRLKRRGPWPDAAGPPLYENEIFRLYRMRSDVPGRDLASQRFK